GSPRRLPGLCRHEPFAKLSYWRMHTDDSRDCASTSRRRAIVLGLCCVLAPRTSLGQASPARHRIGVIWGSGHPEMLHVFKDAMSAYGWIDGRNVEYVERLTETSAPNLERLVADLVGARVDLLFLDEFAVGPALRVTRTVPIVCPNSSDPV